MMTIIIILSISNTAFAAALMVLASRKTPPQVPSVDPSKFTVKSLDAPRGEQHTLVGTSFEKNERGAALAKWTCSCGVGRRVYYSDRPELSTTEELAVKWWKKHHDLMMEAQKVAPPQTPAKELVTLEEANALRERVAHLQECYDNCICRTLS